MKKTTRDDATIIAHANHCADELLLAGSHRGVFIKGYCARAGVDPKGKEIVPMSQRTANVYEHNPRASGYKRVWYDGWDHCDRHISAERVKRPNRMAQAQARLAQQEADRRAERIKKRSQFREVER